MPTINIGMPIVLDLWIKAVQQYAISNNLDYKLIINSLDNNQVSIIKDIYIALLPQDDGKKN